MYIHRYRGKDIIIMSTLDVLEGKGKIVIRSNGTIDSLTFPTLVKPSQNSYKVDTSNCILHFDDCVGLKYPCDKIVQVLKVVFHNSLGRSRSKQNKVELDILYKYHINSRYSFIISDIYLIATSVLQYSCITSTILNQPSKLTMSYIHVICCSCRRVADIYCINPRVHIIYEFCDRCKDKCKTKNDRIMALKFVQQCIKEGMWVKYVKSDIKPGMVFAFSTKDGHYMYNYYIDTSGNIEDVTIRDWNTGLLVEDKPPSYEDVSA